MIVRNIGVENWTDAPKIKIGICAMGKKTTSKERIIIKPSGPEFDRHGLKVEHGSV